jgi:hypothetical protein
MPERDDYRTKPCCFIPMAKMLVGRAREALVNITLN